MSDQPVNPDYETLEVTVEDRIAHVRLNRPDKANAMNIPMWDDLRSCFRWADEAPSVRVVVLSGNGKNFCSGMDLSVFGHLVDGFTEDTGRNSEKLRRVILKLQDDLTAIESCRKPVLAAIHGAAVGGAIDMITCCDMRYCTAEASFSIREIDIGMAADVGTLQRLPRLIGEGQARELAYTGRDFDGREAAELGLVNRIYADREALLDGVLAIAREIAAKSPLAVRGTKEMITYARDHSVADGLNYVATWNAAMLMSPDLRRSIEAQVRGQSVDYED